MNRENRFQQFFLDSIRAGVTVFLVTVALQAECMANEKSRSPFSRSPGDVFVEEPCRFMGTFHKESRQRLERFYVRKDISLDEWKCMAAALKRLDDEATQSCKKADQTIEVIEARQAELYRTCLPGSKHRLVKCGMLSLSQFKHPELFAACFHSSE